MAAAQLFHTHTQSLNTKSEFPICLAQCHWLFLSLTIYRYLSFWVVVYCITLKEDCNLFAFALNRIASFMGENLPRKSIQLHQIVCGLTKRTGKRRRERKKKTKEEETIISLRKLRQANEVDCTANQKRSCHLIYDLLTLAVY